MRYLTAFFLCLATPLTAQCPDPTLESARYAATGSELIAPKGWDVAVRGTHAAPCDDWAKFGRTTDGLEGFLPVAPTAVFELSGMAPHILTVTASATCEPVLAVRTGDGVWYVGQGAGGTKDVTLWGAPDADMQVWLGSTDPEGCEGTLILETFDR